LLEAIFQLDKRHHASAWLWQRETLRLDWQFAPLHSFLFSNYGPKHEVIYDIR